MWFSEKAYHTCKSIFCSSCGKKATDKWMKEKFSNFPATNWQHITFTLPSELWEFFWFKRKLIGMIPPLAAGIILAIAAKKFALPAIYLAIHTFGRDLKRNLHFHLTTTNSGIHIYKLFWRDMIIKAFGFDPLKCIKCSTIMLLELIILPLKIALNELHEIIAHGAFE